MAVTRRFTLETYAEYCLRAQTRGYPTPKWVRFCFHFLSKGGYGILYYDAVTTVSKYVTIRKNKKQFKVRFSNHKPNKGKEIDRLCDFFVGASHLNANWYTWEDAIKAAEKYLDNPEKHPKNT